LGINLCLRDIPCKLPVLAVFAERLRSGEIAPRKHRLKAGSVADYMCSIGEEIASLGDAPDPRLGIGGQVHTILRQPYAAYSRDDDPPERVKPVPFQLLKWAVERLQTSTANKAIADLLVIGYFFLLRPGECCYKRGEDNTPFRLQDVSLEIHDATLNAAVLDLSLLEDAAKVTLRFTTQKNGIQDEDITHGSTDDPMLCPRKAVARRIRHLRENNAPSTAPLFTVYDEHGRSTNISSTPLTAWLRKGAAAEELKHLNFSPTDVSARALRAGGCMALFRANISQTNMQLMGRWRSSAMKCYLHRAGADTIDFAQKMITFGSFKLNAHSPLPLPADVIPIVLPYLDAPQA